jgi:hypothetical protein
MHQEFQRPRFKLCKPTSVHLISSENADCSLADKWRDEHSYWGAPKRGWRHTRADLRIVAYWFLDQSDSQSTGLIKIWCSCFMLASCLDYSSTLECSSETSVDFQRDIRRITESMTLYELISSFSRHHISNYIFCVKESLPSAGDSVQKL